MIEKKYKTKKSLSMISENEMVKTSKREQLIKFLSSEIGTGEPVFFKFEEDFAIDFIRCIPMIVRIKLDLCGVKLKLSQWCRFTHEQRFELSAFPILCNEDVEVFKDRLLQLIEDDDVSFVAVNEHPDWAELDLVPQSLQNHEYIVSGSDWSALSYMQRFALTKLAAQSHESKNLPAALKEFSII
jgi:hypothetical protein